MNFFNFQLDEVLPIDENYTSIMEINLLIERYIEIDSIIVNTQDYCVKS